MLTIFVETPWDITASSGIQLGRRTFLPRGQGKHLMLRCSVLESTRSAQYTHVVPPHSHQPLSNRSWVYCAGAVVLCMLSLTWTMQAVAAADPAGFAQNCSGFAQDPLLGAL